MSSDGAANLDVFMQAVQGAVASGVFSSDGASTMQLAASQTTSVAASMDGSASPALAGASTAAGAQDAAGAALATFEVIDKGASFSSDGVGTGTLAGAAIAAAALSADGAASLILASDQFLVDAADFDGAGDFMSRGADLTGGADGKAGTFSCWVRLDGGNGLDMGLLENNTDRLLIYRDLSNKFHVQGVSAASAIILKLISSTSYTSAATWLHLLASWDLAAAAGHLYVTDVSDLAAGSTLTNATIDYSGTNWSVGLDGAFTAGQLDACLAEMWFTQSYIDLSVTANRRKFISATGKPVFLGSDGSLPTGSAPLIYFHLDDGEAVENFAVNRGGGGNFTISGTLDTATTSPSD